ncbi:hypothetical protein PILCRDRAFT_825520 [Piloderma croceum F 1598]|uniref:Acetyl-CoA synthetase-like protein n=1 Tax=Piloderma croceum (strain F 1598) TaxID=765440 RepID=A0A0C3BIK3_PILCF|nr:hypothetical protein PILCRDRAFT_825520 [Piloderma croceum F 1598]
MIDRKIYRSPYPDVELPEISIWHFIFDHPNPPADDKVIYVDCLTDRKIKFGELKSLSKRLAYGLVHRAKLAEDDVMLVFSANTLLYPALVQAAQAATICVTLANPTYQVDELEHQIKDSDAKVIVVGKSVIEVAKGAAIRCGIADHNIYITEEEDHEHFKSIWSLASFEELEPRRLSAQEAKQRTAFMCYSSGTTGKAKGVETTHYNVTSAILQLLASDPDPYTPSAKFVAILPLYHIYGTMVFIFITPFCHATGHILPRFELETWLNSIQKYRITRAQIVPPIVVLLAKHPIIDKYDLSSVKEWACAAAPLGHDLIEAVENRTKIRVIEGYGMTETTCVISACRRETMKRGTVGQMIPNMLGKIVDGELLVKGPNIMKGYLGNSGADQATFTEDGWMKTGDVAQFDDEGDLFIVDRVKELIKYKGSQVPPAELEDLLLKHPDIDDAAVIGVYKPAEATEVPRAYVVLSARAKSKTNIEAAIIAWVAERVANHKKLRGGVEVVDVIPKSPSGKILRKILRNQAGVKTAESKL